MGNRTFALLVLSVCAAFAAKVASAANVDDAENAAPPNTERADREAPASKPPPSISARDASAIVRQAYGGRVVSATASTRNIGGNARRGFDVRVDVEGRVKTVFVDRRGRIHEQR